MNPGNQVSNLAQGGYNTYKLMPNGFIPPSGRPFTDTLKNISKAISLNPDAIILNLPSNDVASGFSLAEQIYNMDSIFSTAQIAGIPIWICTTQPRNFSAGQMQLQKDMKDSIFAHYGSFSIDFWKILALPNNGLDPFYDSGDGVHLNDKGHSILFDRVRLKNIIGYLFQPKPFTDIILSDLVLTNYNACVLGSKSFKLTYSNLGIASNDSALLYFRGFNRNQLLYSDSLKVSTSIFPCTKDSINFSFQISTLGQHSVSTFSNYANDTAYYNDSSSIDFNIIGTPSISVIDDTLCNLGMVELGAATGNMDTILWYANKMSTTIINGGSQYLINNLSRDTSLYAQSVRGDLFFKEELLTTDISGINWNGTMFDLIATNTLTIDSLSLKVFDLGNQTVEIRVKSGSYTGFELDSSFWVFTSAIPIIVSDPNEFISIDIPDIQMSPGDTMGVYLQLSNPSSRLRYRSIPNPVLRSDSILSIKTGSGISHNFSGVFFPRDWNGKVHYHYGFRPEGDCVSQKTEVNAYFSNASLDIGNDTILALTNELILIIGSEFKNILWENGTTSNTRIIRGSDFGLGNHLIVVNAIDSLGCHKSDSINISFNISGFDNLEENHFRIYPNPVSTILNTIGAELKQDHVQIFDILGREIRFEIIDETSLGISDLEKGNYILKITKSNSIYQLPFVKD